MGKKWSSKYDGHEGQYFVVMGKIHHLVRKSYHGYYLNDKGERVCIREGEFYNSYEEAWNSIFLPITEGDVVVTFSEKESTTTTTTYVVEMTTTGGIKAVVAESDNYRAVPSSEFVIRDGGTLHWVSPEYLCCEKEAMAEIHFLYGYLVTAVKNLFKSREEMIAAIKSQSNKEVGGKDVVRYLKDDNNEPWLAYAMQKTFGCEVRVFNCQSGNPEQVGSTIEIGGNWANNFKGALDLGLKEFSSLTKVDKEEWTNTYILSTMSKLG